jgi:ubiquinone biosynthesis protein COQ9
MDLRTTEIRAAEAIQHGSAEDMSRRAAKLATLQELDMAPSKAESDIAHALRTRRKLRRPLSTKL